MIRKIKFRAWDKENKCMIGDEDSEADFRFHAGSVSVKYLSEQFYEGGGEIHSRDKWEDCDVEVMQFTGLKDKNGKEIYDHDQVKRRVVDFKEDGGYIDMTCDIKWNGWCYALFIADKQIWGLDPITARECEVIGNIYETPETLTPKNKTND